MHLTRTEIILLFRLGGPISEVGNPAVFTNLEEEMENRVVTDLCRS